MNHKFSQELEDEIIECFKEDYDLTISSETANEFLDSLANLYLWFVNLDSPL